jgi:hypothetical protein
MRRTPPGAELESSSRVSPSLPEPFYRATIGRRASKTVLVVTERKRREAAASSWPSEVARAGFEPATPRFSVVCSTN